MLRKVSRGNQVLADDVNQIIDHILNNEIRGDGKTIIIKKTPKGQTVSTFATSAGGASLYLIKLKTKIDYRTYTADLYGNGIDQDPTIEDIVCKIPVINENDDLTYLLNTDLGIFYATLSKYITTGEEQEASPTYTTYYSLVNIGVSR